MARMTPQEVAEKWRIRTQGASADYSKGIGRVTVAPGQKAAEKAEKMLAGIMESINSGEWARRVAGVSLEEWKRAAQDKGAGRIAEGVRNAEPKMRAFVAEIQPFMDSVISEVDNMPDTTLEDRINRATVYMRRMSEFQRQ